MIKDKTVRDVVESSNEDAKFIIDRITRKYLRKKYPTLVIEGQERIEGRVTDVWYNYESVRC
jgi:hypothetical protein